MNSKNKWERLALLRFIPLLLSILIFSSACASSPPLSTLSKKKKTSIMANKAGSVALEKGRYNEALDKYLEALRLSRSIEDMDGIAINIINISSTYRKVDGYDKAHNYIDEIINVEHIKFDKKYIIEALYIKSAILITQDMRDSVSKLLDEALNICNELKCQKEGNLYNLKSKNSYLNNNYDFAFAYAKKAMTLNEKYGMQKETANSLRLMAKTSTKLKNNKDSEIFYNKALDLDKKLGLSLKIEADLMGLGYLFFEQKKYNTALNYFKRALSVSDNSLDGEIQNKEVKEMIRHCQEKASAPL